MGDEAMLGFGFKQAWFAVRDRAPVEVIQALGLRDLGPVPWRAGLDLAYLTDDRVAVTPPLAGAGGGDWVLATGRLLLRAAGVVSALELSSVLGTEVQFFASHRVMELHRWERARAGELERAFEYVGESGEVRRWQGEPDATERAIGLPQVWSDAVEVLVGEGDVARVAGAWSVDPTSLEGQPAPGPLRAAGQGGAAY